MKKKQRTDRSDYPRIGWISSRLSHKALLALIAVAALSALMMYQGFLNYLRNFSGKKYQQIFTEADNYAKSAADYLKSSGGNCSGLDEYATAHGFFCEVWDEKGTLLFESSQIREENRFLISSSTKAKLSDGRYLTVRAWNTPINVDDVTRQFQQRAAVGLFLMNIGAFVVLAILLYFLVFAPIVGLRRTIREYYEHGVSPKKSSRQDEIGKLQNTFVEMVGVQEDKEHAEHRLVASISHDIKTPLTSVMGFSERLLSAELPEQKQKQYLRNIYDKALVIKGIVDEFDEYLEADIHENAPKSLMEMGNFCEAVRREYQDELSDAGVKLTVDCRCPNEKIRCNFDHMRRFFGNLIDNSIQHAGASHLELHLTCEREDDNIVFLFSDNGHGVPPAIIGQIFEPFFTTDRGRKVSGLGLSICESVIRAHGGIISAENLPSGGLCIRATLPRA